MHAGLESKIYNCRTVLCCSHLCSSIKSMKFVKKDIFYKYSLDTKPFLLFLSGELIENQASIQRCAAATLEMD